MHTWKLWHVWWTGWIMFCLVSVTADKDFSTTQNPRIFRTAFRFPPISPWGSSVWWKLLGRRTLIDINSTAGLIPTTEAYSTASTSGTKTNAESSRQTTAISSSSSTIITVDTTTEQPRTQTTEHSKKLSSTSPNRVPPPKEEAISPSTTLNPIYTKRRKDFKADCKKFESKELYGMLEKVGAYNQKFMAHTPEEAGQRFPPLHESVASINDDNIVKRPVVKITGVPFQPLDSADYLSSSFETCGSMCKSIREKLSDALNRRGNSTPTKNTHGNSTEINYLSNPVRPKSVIADDATDDSGPIEIQEGGNYIGVDEPREKGCSLDTFIPIGNCTQRGEEELWGFEKLCSACHGIYMLSSECFPQFFNSVSCDKSDTRCIFDWWTVEAHGKCHERTLSFTVMRNHGTEECQNWQYETLNVPIACECYLSKASWLKS